MIGEIRTRQMRFLGHVIRKDGLENLALTGKIEGRRGTGRKQMLWMTSLNAWIAERGIRHQEVELIKKARNRVVACHDCPRLRIWHLEREREFTCPIKWATGTKNLCTVEPHYKEDRYNKTLFIITR